MNVLSNPGSWSLLGLIVGFTGTVGVFAVWIMLTMNRWWHQRFHVKRGVNCALGFCGYCSDAWLRGQW